MKNFDSDRHGYVNSKCKQAFRLAFFAEPKAWRIHEFPYGGHQPQRWRRQPSILVTCFQKNCMELKINWTEWVKRTSLGFANERQGWPMIFSVPNHSQLWTETILSKPKAHGVLIPLKWKISIVLLFWGINLASVWMLRWTFIVCPRCA